MLFSVPITDSGLVTEKQLGSLPGHHTRKSLYCLMAKQSLQSVSNHPHWSSLTSNQRPRFPFYFSSHLPHMPGPRCCKHSYMCRHFEIKISLLQDLKAQSLIERFWWIFCWKKSQENRLVISQQSFFLHLSARLTNFTTTENYDQHQGLLHMTSDISYSTSISACLEKNLSFLRRKLC